MKLCPICHSQNGDESYYCTMCGNRLPDESVPVQYQPPVYQYTAAQPVPVVNPFDHTGKFKAEDVSENKLYAIAMYLTGVLGIFIALLAAGDSAYVRFHLRQNLKFLIVETLLVFCAAILALTFIVPIVAGVCLVIVEVIRIIAFFQVAGGKSKEPAIIRSLGFLK